MFLPVKEVLRRSAVLKAPSFGCLKGVPAVNLTRGCLHRCVYCYARSFPETPEKEVHLYVNLPELLARELASRAERGRLPEVITFSTASDLFQPEPRILALSAKVLALVLRYGLRISFLTKGRIPKAVWELLATHAPLVSPRFGLVSLSTEYHRLFEPHTTNPYHRLRQIEKAAKLGLSPAVRLDPIIPGVTDREEVFDSLLRHLAACGVEEVAASYLILRPGVIRQMARELPRPLFKKILLAYQGEPWQRVITSAKTKLAHRRLREKGLYLLKEIAGHYGLRVRICGCKNPDLPFEPCLPWETSSRAPVQKDLFSRL